MDQQQLNEDCIDLVLQHVPPSLLLPCRLISHDWAAAAERRLKSNGWRIHLRSPEEVPEYLRLVQTTNTKAEAEKLNNGRNFKPEMGISLHLQVATNAQHIDALAAANEISTHPCAPPVIALELNFPNLESLGPVMDPALKSLLVSTSPSIRHLTIRLLQQLEANDDPIPFVAPFPHLPALQTLSLEYTHVQVASVPAAILRVLARAAGPLLRRVDLRAVSWGGQWCCEGGRALKSLKSLLPAVGMWCLDEPELARLEELVIYTGLFGMGQLGNNLRFGRLHRLHLHIAGYQTLSQLPRFLAQSCPVLADLEVTEVTPAHLPTPQALPPPEDAEPQELPTSIRHFGHFIRNVNYESVGIDSIRGLNHNNAMLRIMRALPHLTSVTTDYLALTAMARSFQKAQAEMQSVQVARMFLRNSWPFVTKLTVSLPHDSIGDHGSDDPLLQIVCRLISGMYPNLKRLTIKLGTFRHWKHISQHSKLAYALGLAFGLRNLAVKHVEILDFNWAWFLPGDEAEGSCHWTAVGVGLTLQERQNCNLETLTIRGAPPSYYREAPGWPPGAPRWNPLPAELPLGPLLRLMPPNCSGMTLRIDGSLLLLDEQEEIPNLDRGNGPKIVII